MHGRAITTHQCGLTGGLLADEEQLALAPTRGLLLDGDEILLELGPHAERLRDGLERIAPHLEHLQVLQLEDLLGNRLQLVVLHVDALERREGNDELLGCQVREAVAREVELRDELRRSTARYQQVSDLEVTLVLLALGLAHGPSHQRRLVLLVLGIDLGFVVEEQLHNVALTPHGRAMQRRVSLKRTASQ